MPGDGPRGSARHRTVVAVAFATALLLASPVSAAPGELERARAERQTLEAQAAEAAEQLEAISERLAEATTTRARLEADVETLERDAQRAAAAISERVVAQYKALTGHSLQILLASVHPDDVVERARLLDSLDRHDHIALERAAAARGSLASRRLELDELVASLGAEQERAAELRRALEASFALARAHEQELATREARQRVVDRPGQRGVYACPMAVPYHFRDTWGAPRSGGRRHKGVDMYAPMRGQVYAVTNGVIVRHSRSRLGGLGLYLGGDDGHVYYYAHLDSVAPGIAVGRRVEAGELIAFNGDTGNARGGAPHVHMEIRPGGGRQVNPYPYAAAACFSR